MPRLLRERALFEKAFRGYRRSEEGRMIALVAATLVSTAAAARTPCPDGTVPPPDRVCRIRDPFHLFFDWNSAEVQPSIEGLLFNAIGAYGSAQNARIVLAGHTDASGSAAYNLRLSRRRAESVRRYLVSRGVPARAIQVEAWGEARPLIPTADGMREARNSRVELFIETPPD